MTPLFRLHCLALKENQQNQFRKSRICKPDVSWHSQSSIFKEEIYAEQPRGFVMHDKDKRTTS